jgi:alkylation response protein AidB-like acyl-CoA dehydrogenase
VPDHNKIAYADNFATGTNKILEPSRLGVAWAAAGGATGVYETCIKYAVERK